MVPPINPMDGVEEKKDADKKEKGPATANFDPQFTALAIWTDVEDAEVENAKQASNLESAAGKATNRGGDAEEHFEHFEGFSFAGVWHCRHNFNTRAWPGSFVGYHRSVQIWRLLIRSVQIWRLLMWLRLT